MIVELQGTLAPAVSDCFLIVKLPVPLPRFTVVVKPAEFHSDCAALYFVL